ncbi:MAG: hypothetical protein AB8B73_13175 [Ekhidna sp.]
MRNLIFFLFGIAVYACSPPRVDQILVPKLESNFYSKAIKRIDSELESDPTNQKLVDQKLYYCEQLGWPITCISALEMYKSQNGMTNQLVEQYIIYYAQNQKHQQLVNIIEKWSEEYDLKSRFHKPLIKSFVELEKRDRALTELRSYMVERNEIADFEFASEQFILLQDTLMATYYLGKISQLDPDNELIPIYGQMLISLNFSVKGFDILNRFSSLSKNKDFDLMLAKLHSKEGDFVKARNLIIPYIDDDTISYLLSDWYLKEKLWDSAIFTINRLIELDSSNVKAIWKKARIYEDRGWLATSLTHFNSILKIQPEDTITVNRIDLIQRKIAYLQRKKFEENKIQIKEIEPIKFNQ